MLLPSRLYCRLWNTHICMMRSTRSTLARSRAVPPVGNSRRSGISCPKASHPALKFFYRNYIITVSHVIQELIFVF